MPDNSLVDVMFHLGATVVDSNNSGYAACPCGILDSLGEMLVKSYSYWFLVYMVPGHIKKRQSMQCQQGMLWVNT